MSFHQYKCNKCEKNLDIVATPIDQNIKGYVDTKKGYECGYSVLVSSLSEEEIKNLKDWQDPRDFEVYETTIISASGDIPVTFKCPECKKGVMEKIIGENLSGYVKGLCFTNLERERKFYQKGMDKQQAENFYKESIAASKERIDSGKEHYKQVVPDLDHMRKTGQIKKVSDKKKKERMDNIKRMNQHIHKSAGIDPLKKP